MRRQVLGGTYRDLHTALQITSDLQNLLYSHLNRLVEMTISLDAFKTGHQVAWRCLELGGFPFPPGKSMEGGSAEAPNPSADFWHVPANQNQTMTRAAGSRNSHRLCFGDATA